MGMKACLVAALVSASAAFAVHLPSTIQSGARASATRGDAQSTPAAPAHDHQPSNLVMQSQSHRGKVQVLAEPLCLSIRAAIDFGKISNLAE